MTKYHSNRTDCGQGLGASVPDRAAHEPSQSSLSRPIGEHPLRCGRCEEPKRNEFYQGKRALRCGCYTDYRTPVEVRRDAVLDKYGDDPAAYTPAVLAELAKDGLFDVTSAFCPAGKLSMAETRAREAAARRA